ncbi:MAG TPA: serine/threonine-protein kinase, partial [Pirellulaceae bacterium]|nr:serine/threonine-protein kinase [Pirellulaceae bacterium]
MHGPPQSVLDSSSQPASLEGDRLLVACCEELENQLRSGQPARAEVYLSAHPALADDPEAALDLIYVEYAVRRELGEKPQPEEYFERFGQWRDLLKRQFQLENLLDDSASVPEAAGDSAAATVPPLVSSGDRYRVQGLIARGGIGQVMRATDTELHREVAVKELQPALADSDEVRARFLREAEITGKLEHPGIVPVYGLGCDAAGRPFYAMRLVHGQSLQEASEEFHRRPPDDRRFGGIEFQKLLRRFLHVCQTVAYAHSRGVVHRDLKPENILLGPFGETLVVDWGLAKVMAHDELTLARPPPATGDAGSTGNQRDDSRATSLAHLSSALTQDAGQWIGTPAYMCPEQALGQAHRVGTAGDVYSLGATLYMLLTGRAPIVDSNVARTLKRVIAGEFPRPREVVRAVPRTLEAVCLKAMALRPEDRYASPIDLADDLERWLADEPVTAARDNLVAKLARWGRRNRTRVVAGAIALVVVTIVSLMAAILINGERLRADRERIKADRQRVEADRRNARLAFDRGYVLTRDQEHGAGLLWYARALAHAPREDAPLRRVILTNMNAARHHLLRRGE